MPKLQNPDSRWRQMVRDKERKILEWVFAHPNVKSVPQAALFLEVGNDFIYKKMKEVGLDHRDYKKSKTPKEKRGHSEKARQREGSPDKEGAPDAGGNGGAEV